MSVVCFFKVFLSASFSARDLGANEKEAAKKSGVTPKHISALLPLSERPEHKLGCVQLWLYPVVGHAGGRRKKGLARPGICLHFFCWAICVLRVTGVPRPFTGAVLILALATLTTIVAYSGKTDEN